MDREKDTLQKTDERRTWDDRSRPDDELAANDEAGTEAVGAGAGALGGAAGGAGLGDKAEEEIEEEDAKPADERRF